MFMLLLAAAASPTQTYATETFRHRACLIELRHRDPKKDAAKAVLRGDTRVYAQLAEENTIYEAPGLRSCRISRSIRDNSSERRIRNEIIEKFGGVGGEPASYRACGDAMMRYMEIYNRFLQTKLGSKICR